MTRRPQVDTISDSPLLAELAAAGVAAPAEQGPNFVKWAGDGFHLIVRVDLTGQVQVDPTWRDEQGWDRLFAPKRFDSYPAAVASIADFLAAPCRVTAVRKSPALNVTEVQS